MLHDSQGFHGPLAYTFSHAAEDVSATSAHALRVAGRFLRTQVGKAERHYSRAAQRDELANLSEALKRDIGLDTMPCRNGDTLPPAMNGRFHLGPHHADVPLVWHSQSETTAKDLRALAIEEVANPLCKPRRSSGGYSAASVATVTVCCAVIGLVWLF